MKTLIPVPLSSLPLYVLTEEARTAHDICPFLQEGAKRVEVDGAYADDALGGSVSVCLFETEPECHAFAAGIDLANPGDDYTWQAYELSSPVYGCRFVVVFHNCDCEPELSVMKFSAPEKETGERLGHKWSRGSEILIAG